MKKLFTLFCLFTFIHLSVNIKAQDSSNFPFSDNINIENFVITSKVLSNNRIDFKFDIIGKYQRLDMAIYVGNTNDTSLYSTNRICTIYWNDDKDEPIYYPEKITKPFWHGAINSKYNNHVISGKYFLVVDYWYNGVKQTKTLEFHKEPDNNDLAILNVRMQEDYPGAKPFEVKPNSNITLKVASYRVFVTVANNGTSNLEEGIKIEAKGFHPSGPRHINSSGKIPFILKGLQAEAIFNMVAPLSPNYSIGTTILNNELEIKLDPTNSLNDTNLANNSFKIKYTFNNSMPGTKSNIDVYDASGNRIKSTAVNDLEKGVQEIKKSLPKGHYYFNIDGEKTQVKIQ
ncbi:hypothetical protein [Empedobacter brevis]|uniref:hypothetical protein n=1 Tax=Empedobacter brevis TaxID=247 RepID=UPI002FDFD0CD